MQKKKIVLNGILIALVLVIGLVLYSEKVNKIEIVDNVKNVLSEQIQKAINVLSGKEDITEVDVTGLVMGQETEHEHLWKTMYDENKHWEECTACGEISNEVEHTFETTWASGSESCDYSNFYTKTCLCGYSETGHKSCVWDGKTYIQNAGFYHQRKCSICGDRIYYSYYLNNYGNGTLYQIETPNGKVNCTDSNGNLLNCDNPGTCNICKRVFSGQTHKLIGKMQSVNECDLECESCGKNFGTAISEVSRDNNTPNTYTIQVNIKLANGATFNSKGLVKAVSEPWESNTSTVSNLSSDKKECTITYKVKFKSTWKNNYGAYVNFNVNINNNVCSSFVQEYMLYPDSKEPIILDISNADSILTEWSRTKPIIISGTENYCNTVRVKIEDTEENIIFEGETTVTNGQYSISCTPDIEASESGRVLKAIVTDACENSTEQEFTIAKVDSVAPEATSENEILGDWAQSKDFTFAATDYGIGNVSIAFNDVEDYELATKDEETYSRNYRFVGDVYNLTQARVFYKDELGNVSTQVITIDKIDNTAPTITNAKLNNNKLVIESNDEHPELGEGSGVVKYRYLSSDTKLENPSVTEEWKEADSNSEIVIENINEAKYIYIVAEDLVGNVGSIYELEVLALVLNTEVNLEAANGKGGVDLDWSTYDATDKVFKVYQKKEDSEEWETISTFDFYSKGIEPIKVLNVYPESKGKWNIPIVKFNYLDGTSENLPKSAALKVWMEGGTMTEGSTTTTFNAYGKNPITGEQIIKVTPISGKELNNNPDVLWNYDIVMFGTWDGNGWYEPDENAYSIIEKYIKAGYGILGGHDTIGGYISSSTRTLNRLRQYFNVEIGYWNNETTDLDVTDYNTGWGYISSYIKVDKNGLLTNFPYELPLGTKLTIPETHTCSNAALGSTWMTFIDGNDNAWNYGSINNYYNIGGKGNPLYYLTTWNNTAMIQTGHSNCESTDDERKVLANTLFYLKQITKAKRLTDNSSQDLKAPDAPIINAEKENQNIKVSFNSEDNGSTYSFYVEAYDSNDVTIKLATSNQRTETVTTGTKGYYYIIDEDSENTDFDITASGVQYTTDENVMLNGSNNGKYIHMKAEDVAGNISEASVIKIEVLTNVTVNLDGGKIGEKDTVELEPALAGKTINLDELGKPEKEGYRFCYWEATIGNINGNEYTYPIQDDVITAIYEKIPDLILNTEVNLDAANGKGGVDLDWEFNLDDTIYKVYQKKDDQEGAEWETISTFDFYDENVEAIKVLNVYPESNSTAAVPSVTFKYLDGTSANLSKSAALKVWMEGGTMTEGSTTTTFNAYGKNPITGKQIIEVTPVSTTSFNSNPNIIWNYDIVMVGTWDSNAYIHPNNNALAVMEEYINAGYGILAGHDTMRYYSPNPTLGSLRRLRKYFNIEVGTSGTYNSNEADYKLSWAYLSSYVTIDKNGLLTNFPYELPLGTKLKVPETHTNMQAALGNVWMSFVNGTDNFVNLGSINNYYNLGGKGNPVYYLTTWNNTAMIQTGHSKCESTDDERKVLANTLFYLKQITKSKRLTDNSSQDLKAPDAPTISAEKENQNIKVSFNSEDNGSTYSFYVEAYDSNDVTTKLATSNQRTETVTTGTKGYYYIIDEDSENKDFDVKTEGVQYTTDKNILLDALNNGKYIHMKAEDVAGNISEASVIKIEVLTNVTINLDGGKIGEKDTVELEPALVGKIINLDELGKPEKEGYRFCYWEATIGNINGNEYTYPAQDDVITAIYEKIPDLILNTEVNLDAANGKGGVDLDWEFNLDDTIFKAYQKKDDEEGAEWESISTFDFYSKSIEPINVLNVYSVSTSARPISTVTFKYLDGTSKSLPKSAALKVWMEGGTMTESGKTTTFTPYGKNPITGEQIIKVTPVSNTDFNNNPNIIWDYDVVMFGTWDGNGTNTSQPNDNAVKVIEEYIKAGYGILTGHDTIGLTYYNIGLNKLRKYFNIEVGHYGTIPSDLSVIDYNTSWAYQSTYVRVNRSGLLTNFPYELPLGAKLTIPLSHTSSNAATGNVWMTLTDGTDNRADHGSINNYYNAGGTGNPQYYLTTWNNTAMIQTGHSNGESTDDERKVLANTLFYLKQRTTEKSFTDNSSQDLKAPNAPTINAEAEINKIKVNFNSEDNGSTYSFYVEAYDSNDSSIKLATSNQRTETVTTGTKGYYYIINEDSNNTDFDITASGVQYTTDENILLDASNNGKYIHMKAEDVAGNIGEASTLKLDVKTMDLEETISIEVTKKWIDNNIQALRRPDKIKFVVTQYESKSEESTVTSEEIISNEDTNLLNDEKTEENNFENKVDKIEEEHKNVEENSQDTTEIDEATNSTEENKILENAFSNEIIKSSMTNEVSELINSKSLEVESEITNLNQEEQIENDSNLKEEENSELKQEELIQDDNSSQQSNEQNIVDIVEENIPNSKTSEESNVLDETETINPVNTVDTTTPEGEKIEIFIYEFTMSVNKEENETVYKLEGLPRYDQETFEEIKYIITEEEVNEGDLKFYESTGGLVTQETDEEGNVKYSAEIVNTFRLPENNTQNITAIKNWNDNNKISTRPTNIILELIGRVQNLEIIENETQESTEITYKDSILKEGNVSNSNNWKNTFTSVPIYDENGQEIEYTLQEKADQEVLNKYISEVSQINESNEIIVTNSLIVQDSKIEKTGTEEINAIDSKVSYNIDYTIELDNKYDENATIEIVDTLPYQIDEEKSDLKGGIYNYDEEKDIATITWTGIYNSIDKTVTLNNNTDEVIETTENKDRNVQVLSINFEIGVVYKDIQISTEKITNKVSGKITLANDVTDLVEDSFETGTRWVKDVVVNKMWKGDTIETRPDSITVQLVSNRDVQNSSEENSIGTENTDSENQSTTVEITPITTEEETTEWTYTWSELPTYDAEGNEIKYTVDETEINYTKGEQTVENEYYCEKTEEVIDGKTVVTLTNIKYGSITVEKVDSRKEEIKLPGAEFKLEKMIQDVITGEWMVPEETNEEYLAYTGITREDGTYTFEGLKYGHYKLTETKAPEDYKISEKDIDVIEVNEENADVEVTIGNIKMYKLPITGGIGVDTIRNAEILAGIVALILITNRKKVVPERRSRVEAKKIKRLEKLGKKHKIKEQ